MLEIKLQRALAPDQLDETDCGVCGSLFCPGSVTACLDEAYVYSPICHGCFRWMARRADEGDIPARWNEDYRDFLIAEARHPEPMFPTIAALEAYELAHGGYPDDKALAVS